MNTLVGGWKKDPFDKRDFILPTMRAAAVPDRHSLEELLPPVRNQGNSGSCVGFGIGANICAMAKKLGIWTDWYSPTWIYNGARFLEGTLHLDVGCYPSDALKWLSSQGSLLEKFWRYNGFETRVPGSTVGKDAVKYRGFTYSRVVDGVDGLCSAIASGQLVSIGTPWFENWMEAPAGILGSVTSTSKAAGGHETILYGYNKNLEHFYGMNSWGADWGDGGRYAMPFGAIKVFKELGGYDGHVVSFTAEKPGKPGCLLGWLRESLNSWKLFFSSRPLPAAAVTA